jgi:16S rRNA (guanine966-N2)-methyltransferase
LFAGSGALGLEALSRGAKSVAFVDSSRAVCEAIKDHLKVLKQDACVHQQDAFSFLEATQKSFDIIFLDPPFHQNLITPISEKIAEKQLLKPEGYLYIEKEKQADFKLPPDFKLLKEKIAGQVTYSLAQFANE